MRSQRRSGRGPAVVRAMVRVLVLGGAATFVCLVMFWRTDGLPSAAALLLAWFLATVTMGGAVAAAVDRMLEEPLEDDAGAGPGCRWCGQPLMALGAVAVCPRCDRLPLDHRSRRRARA